MMRKPVKMITRPFREPVGINKEKFHICELEGQRGVIQILLFLYKNGETIYGKLFNNPPQIQISNNTTANRALEILQKNDLVKLRIDPGKHSHYYSLTPKGQQVVEYFMEMENILMDKTKHSNMLL